VERQVVVSCSVRKNSADGSFYGYFQIGGQGLVRMAGQVADTELCQEAFSGLVQLVCKIEVRFCRKFFRWWVCQPS
jgi:hypothetical protein